MYGSNQFSWSLRPAGILPCSSFRMTAFCRFIERAEQGIEGRCEVRPVALLLKIPVELRRILRGLALACRKLAKRLLGIEGLRLLARLLAEERQLGRPRRLTQQVLQRRRAGSREIGKIGCSSALP